MGDRIQLAWGFADSEERDPSADAVVDIVDRVLPPEDGPCARQDVPSLSDQVAEKMHANLLDFLKVLMRPSKDDSEAVLELKAKVSEKTRIELWKWVIAPDDYLSVPETRIDAAMEARLSELVAKKGVVGFRVWDDQWAYREYAWPLSFRAACRMSGCDPDVTRELIAYSLRRNGDRIPGTPDPKDPQLSLFPIDRRDFEVPHG